LDNEELIQQQMKRGEEIAKEVQEMYPSKFSKPPPGEISQETTPSNGNGGDDSVSSG